MSTSEESVVATWIFIFILALVFATTSFLAYTVVGDAGQPNWSYGTVRDVPAESPYAVYQKLPHPQHVRGTRGE